MGATRVTLSLDEQVVREARTISDGNLSRLVNGLLRERLDTLHRMRLRDDLRLGYLAEAERDLEIVHEFRHIDQETGQMEEL